MASTTSTKANSTKSVLEPYFCSVSPFQDNVFHSYKRNLIKSKEFTKYFLNFQKSIFVSNPKTWPVFLRENWDHQFKQEIISIYNHAVSGEIVDHLQIHAPLLYKLALREGELDSFCSLLQSSYHDFGKMKPKWDFKVPETEKVVFGEILKEYDSVIPSAFSQGTIENINNFTLHNSYKAANALGFCYKLDFGNGKTISYIPRVVYDLEQHSSNHFEVTLNVPVEEYIGYEKAELSEVSFEANQYIIHDSVYSNKRIISPASGYYLSHKQKIDEGSKEHRYATEEDLMCPAKDYSNNRYYTYQKIGSSNRSVCIEENGKYIFRFVYEKSKRKINIYNKISELQKTLSYTIVARASEAPNSPTSAMQHKALIDFCNKNRVHKTVQTILFDRNYQKYFTYVKTKTTTEYVKSLNKTNMSTPIGYSGRLTFTGFTERQAARWVTENISKTTITKEIPEHKRSLTGKAIFSQTENSFVASCRPYIDVRKEHYYSHNKNPTKHIVNQIITNLDSRTIDGISIRAKDFGNFSNSGVKVRITPTIFSSQTEYRVVLHPRVLQQKRLWTCPAKHNRNENSIKAHSYLYGKNGCLHDETPHKLREKMFSKSDFVWLKDGFAEEDVLAIVGASDETKNILIEAFGFEPSIFKETIIP